MNLRETLFQVLAKKKAENVPSNEQINYNINRELLSLRLKQLNKGLNTAEYGSEEFNTLNKEYTDQMRSKLGLIKK